MSTEDWQDPPTWRERQLTQARMLRRARRAHRLEPDPAAAPVVRWMFAQRWNLPEG